eukprot:8823132-Pyramimonas_sp.AAC.1
MANSRAALRSLSLESSHLDAGQGGLNGLHCTGLQVGVQLANTFVEQCQNLISREVQRFFYFGDLIVLETNAAEDGSLPSTNRKTKPYTFGVQRRMRSSDVVQKSCIAREGAHLAVGKVDGDAPAEIGPSEGGDQVLD